MTVPEVVLDVVISLGLLALWIGLSILYRRLHGKPILFFGVRDATYQQRSASGHSNRNWLTKLGGARNCLVVAVASRRLIIRPWFPFTLMFLPEIYGLEHEVPIENIVGVRAYRTFFSSALDLEFRDESGQTQSVSLYLRDPNMLTSTLRQAGVALEGLGA